MLEKRPGALTFPHLTPIERKIAELLLQSVSRAETARILGCSPDTVKSTVKSMYAKLEIPKDGLRRRIVRLGLRIHEQRAELGVRCQACGEM